MGIGHAKPVDLSGEVNLNHFRLQRVVGRGAFGKVRIVERKDTNLLFALKYIRKDEVIKSESVRNIIRERRMLEHVNHPFICNLRYSFQDVEYMYLVVDLMTGGDLRFHISRKTFTEEAVRFWIAELGCALRYIHQQCIIHRDVKPDNVLLDSEGHVHLTDFNVASDVSPGKILSSRSGTLAYLAPEVYAGHGYDVRADWWSLGVTFYECIYNKRPFDGATEKALAETVLTCRPRFPITSPPVRMACINAMRMALAPDPNKRMGSTWESFTKHKFFARLDFDALERKEIEPVFVPSSEKTNFDATYDLEELLLEEAPLEARARRQKPREPLKQNASVKEVREDELYRLIERDFRNFDYTLSTYDKIAQQCSVANKQPLPVAMAASKSGGSGSGGSRTPPSPRSPHRLPPLQIPLTATSGDANLAQTSSSGIGDGSAFNSGTSTPRVISRPRSVLGSPSPVAQQSSHARQRTSAAPSQASQPQQQQQQQSYQQQQGTSLSRQAPPALRVHSPSGGMQVTLDGTGSWSELARQDATLPGDACALSPGAEKSASGSGMLHFFKSRKGRAHSPRSKERGVLGKDGFRVIVG